MITKKVKKEPKFYLRATYQSMFSKDKEVYYVTKADENRNTLIAFETMNNLIPLTKTEWKDLFEQTKRFEVIGSGSSGKHSLDNYKLKYIKAPETGADDLFKLYYTPHKDWPGSFTLSDLKRDLKSTTLVSKPISITKFTAPNRGWYNIECYEICFNTEDKDNALAWMENVQNYADITKEVPTRRSY